MGLGTMDLRSLVAAAVVAIVSSLAVTALLSRDSAITFGPSLSLATILIAALVNAITEEVVWRAAAIRLLMCVFRFPVALILSATSFGAAHFAYGAPGGFAGAVASGLFGVAQGLVFRRTGSLLLPVVIHMVVNVVILWQL